MYMKRMIFLFILICFAISANAQTFTEIYRNDKFKINEFTGNLPEVFIINNEDDDTIWVSYFDQTLENSKIISLDKDLNIISSTEINYPLVLSAFTYKIHDKFYRVSSTNQDTLKFRCFDRNGNNLIDKSLWINNNEDTLWFNSWSAFKYRILSNNNFLLIANAQYPSDTTEIYSSEALWETY